jgi:hypothetical protein
MKAPYFLIILFILITPAHAWSQSSASKETASPAVSQSPGAVTYKDLLEFQDKTHTQQLQVQKEISDRAIQSITQQTQTIVTIVQIGGFLFVLFSALLGWWVKRQVDNFARLSKQSEDILSVIEKKLMEVKNIQKSFTSRIDGLADSVGPLETQFQKYSSELNKFDDSVFEDMKIKMMLAWIGNDLRSNRLGDRLRAAQAASEIVQRRGGSVAIPILLECLRVPDMDPPVMAEALYGLTYRAKELAGDEEAIKLIIAAGQSPEKTVRKQSLETIAQIALTNPNLQQHIKSCFESDEEVEVRELAGRILSKNKLS